MADGAAAGVNMWMNYLTFLWRLPVCRDYRIARYVSVHHLWQMVGHRAIG